MATTLKRAVTRQTSALIRDRGKLRPLMVRLEVGGSVLRCWLKGTRTAYVVPMVSLYDFAVRIKLEQIRAERAAKKSGGKHIRGNRR